VTRAPHPLSQIRARTNGGDFCQTKSASRASKIAAVKDLFQTGYSGLGLKRIDLIFVLSTEKEKIGNKIKAINGKQKKLSHIFEIIGRA
jgi:hypothetical protein